MGYLNKDGYLSANYSGCRWKGLHQYIWMVGHQCEIPKGYDVHHINENKLDNRLCNLELINHSEHAKLHTFGIPLSEETKQKIKESNGIKVIQLTKNDEMVKIWESARDCIRNGYTHISECCRGERKTSKGFKWMYLEDYLKQKKR